MEHSTAPDLHQLLESTSSRPPSPRTNSRRSRRLQEPIHLAELMTDGPWKESRPSTRARRLGKTFERKVATHLQAVSVPQAASVPHSPASGKRAPLQIARWIHFVDARGPGWAQPDIFLEMEERILLLEVKLTERMSAWPQMRELYAPLLRKIYRKRVDCVQVAKNLWIGSPAPIIHSVKCLDELQDGHVWHLHRIGRIRSPLPTSAPHEVK